ncbi:MAG: ABC transporter substrate-binding protein [Acidobacteriota bacterium]
MKPVTLNGITWNHSRALPPLVATAQRFEELHPGVEIVWRRRSLHEFGHADITELAKTFDLLVVDHPFTGDAEAKGALEDLLPLLTAEEVKDFETDTMGQCFESYVYHGRLYALPIDAAAPAASLRPDVLARNGAETPGMWSDVIRLAHRGLVRMPAFPADLFLNWMGLCVSSGATVASNPEQLADRQIGTAALEMLRELAELMPAEIYRLNPIGLYEQMASTDRIAYCPFAYTYSNYSREGFGAKRVRFADPVLLNDGRTMRTVLGGTGIAISTGCAERSLALEYIRFVANPTCQRTLYGVAGGQPARRSAWRDAELNALSDDFFLRTAGSVETAYVRPRYRGYVALQEHGGSCIAEFCRDGGDAQLVLEKVDALYRASLGGGSQ